MSVSLERTLLTPTQVASDVLLIASLSFLFLICVSFASEYVTNLKPVPLLPLSLFLEQGLVYNSYYMETLYCPQRNTGRVVLLTQFLVCDIKSLDWIISLFLCAKVDVFWHAQIADKIWVLGVSTRVFEEDISTVIISLRVSSRTPWQMSDLNPLMTWIEQKGG